MSYIGRFAPSPTGPLHTGSLVAALASWLDARAYAHCFPDKKSIWIVRIEDVDVARCVPGADVIILRQLGQCGLISDLPVMRQSQRTAVYQAALDELRRRLLAYPCACSRQAIESIWQAQGRKLERHQELIYPGTCRRGLGDKPPRAWRFAVTPLTSVASGVDPVIWQDRRLGTQQQCVSDVVGDYVLQRADGYFSYQLAVVVDDAQQGVTHVVRGEDLADNTPRQLLLQRALQFAAPSYLHTPLVRDAQGQKLSKQTGALPIDTEHPLAALQAAAQILGLPPVSQVASVSQALSEWTTEWARLWVR